MHVLDLPPLYTHPSAESLLRILNTLAIQPATFDGSNDTLDEDLGRGSGDSIPRYLTSIISSPLQWISDDSLREQLWEAASARLSERSGRTAMHTVTRTFSIPTSPTPGSPVLAITLREPALTGDNLGHKTWAASYLLAKRLPLLVPLLSPLVLLAARQAASSTTTPTAQDMSMPRILELGAGTGLVGIAAAAIFAADVWLSDLPAIVSNLAHNVSANEALVASWGGSLSAFVLDWNNIPRGMTDRSAKFDVVVASDPLYGPEHPALVAGCVERFLRVERGARCVVEAPVREAYRGEVEAFRREMKSRGLIVVGEGEEVGFDDWEGGTREVRCWWGVWGWDEARLEGIVVGSRGETR